MTTAIQSSFRTLPLCIQQLSLAAVLKCGQSFRWSCIPLAESPVVDPLSPTHEYRFCLQDRVLCLRQTADTLFYRAIFPQDRDTKNLDSDISISDKKDAETVAFIRDYFQLDLDLVLLYGEWSRRDPVFRSLEERFSGIRMLRQDPWEAIVSFICSSNNNISRISKMVQNLCLHFSSPLVSTKLPTSYSELHTYHPFPPPSVLAAVPVSAKLRELGFGYRAEFVQKTAKMLMEEHGTDEGVFKWLRGLRMKPTVEARVELLKLMGVGRKVADCILLMSLDKSEVVPIDTHVHQIAIKHYGVRGSSSSKPTMNPKLYDELHAKLSAIWGPYAGWAHSILFTADLKAFATYGLTAPPRSRVKESHLPTPSPTPSPQKRKKEGTDPPSLELDDNLADRVKRRRKRH